MLGKAQVKRLKIFAFVFSLGLMTSFGNGNRVLANGGLSLEGAVAIALEANPLIRATAAGQQAAAAGLEEARSNRLPALSFNEKFITSNNPVYVFGSRLEQGKFGMEHFDLNYLNNPGSFSNFRSSVNLSIPLFNRFQISSGIRQAELGEQVAEEDSNWVRQQLRMQVVSAYYGVLVARSRRDVARDAVATAEADLVKIEVMFEEGMVVASDVLAMKVQVADFRQQLVQAEGDEKTAVAALNTVLARPVNTPVELSGELVDREFEVASQDALITAALGNRPDYRKLQLDVQRTQEGIRTAKGSRWPDLNLFANYGYSSHDFASGSGDFAVGAALNFDILDFGRTPRIQQAVAASNGAEAQQEYKANEVGFEVVQAYQRFLSSKERLRVAASAVDQAAETLRIVQDRHGVGLTTVTEVLRAQTALLKSQMMLLGARYDYYLGYANTLMVTGSLNDVSPFTK
ncbi:MAG: TolC family protein [Acidobacteriota bacterium]|nr:MAG: TolC family protein [Acidobacteriota bacterium]